MIIYLIPSKCNDQVTVGRLGAKVPTDILTVPKDKRVEDVQQIVA